MRGSIALLVLLLGCSNAGDDPSTAPPDGDGGESGSGGEAPEAGTAGQATGGGGAGGKGGSSSGGKSGAPTAGRGGSNTTAGTSAGGTSTGGSGGSGGKPPTEQTCVDVGEPFEYGPLPCTGVQAFECTYSDGRPTEKGYRVGSDSYKCPGLISCPELQERCGY